MIYDVTLPFDFTQDATYTLRNLVFCHTRNLKVIPTNVRSAVRVPIESLDSI